MSRRISVCVLMLAFMAAVFGLIGCAQKTPPAPSDAADGTLQSAKREAGGAVPPAVVPPGGVAKDAAGKADGPGDPVATNAPAKRHIIFTSTLDVIVKDLEVAVPEVEKLIAGHKGYIAKSEVKGDTGSKRTATYTLRVPAESFKPLNEGLLALGTPQRNAVDSQDVTEEFVDVQARLKNLKNEEETLNKLLKESTTRTEVLQTREQIKVIRGDIERAQARLDYLSKLTALSTVYLTLREIKDYKPPTAPTFGSRISDTFEKSWEGLVGFAQGAVLVAVALTPWLPILIPAFIALVWAIRKLVRASREVVAESEPRAWRTPPPVPPGDAPPTDVSP
ncbi:MAG: DUF4349 domain-containing protein [Planctomycetia bacterium]|nr:DUF4349 domain-containing protein [Planctomycetia bacterium]